MNKICGVATVKTKNLENYLGNKKNLEIHDVGHKQLKSPQEFVISSQNHVVEITVETKGQKRTSPVTSYSPGQKAEKKRSTTNDYETLRSWSDIFGQRNLLHMTKEQSSKHNENREAEKNINATTKKQQKNTIKHSMKSKQKHSTAPCCSSILVRDCATQCEIYDSNTPDKFNPIHMLHLIKQLKDLVNKKDERTCEIFIEMEQILQKIPDLETKVESSAVPLKESSGNGEIKKMKTMSYELFEQEKLQSEIQKRNEQLKKVHQKYTELEGHAKMLKQQLDKITLKKDDIISMLTQQIANDKENNERIITDLKTNLDKQTELAQQNYINNKYLTMEIDKLSALSSCKDKQITDYWNTIKELQNQIEQTTKEFKSINDTCFKETSPQISLINTGHACSSPTSSFSDGSNKSWHDLSDISSVDSIPKHVLKEDAPIKDFELVSLLDGESSHSILPDQNEVINNKGSIREINNANDTVPCQNTNMNDVFIKKFLPNSSKKSYNKENDIYEMRKFTRLQENQNDNTKKLFLNASSTALESITSTKSIVSDIRKQSDMQNRKPINVPSPLRDYPHPDWSDSSLPSISTVSNLDVIPSNDI